MTGKLVLTGGPSAGKTTIGMAIQRAFPGQVQLIPEAATILFSGGFHRAEDDEGICDQQKAIYAVQVAQESIFRRQSPSRLLVCDRGTMDGLAYWPSNGGDFFAKLGTSEAQELERYDWVIHLETAKGASYNTVSNPQRVEDFEQAIKINGWVLNAWTHHPQRLVVANSRSFLSKMSLVLSLIERILGGAKYEDLCVYLNQC